MDRRDTSNHKHSNRPTGLDSVTVTNDFLQNKDFKYPKGFSCSNGHSEFVAGSAPPALLLNPRLRVQPLPVLLQSLRQREMEKSSEGSLGGSLTLCPGSDIGNFCLQVTEQN